MTTKSTPAQQFSHELAQAQATAYKLQAKADAIEQAASEAARSAELRTLRRQAREVATEARTLRDQLKVELDTLAVSDVGFDELLTKFIAFKTADKRCGAIAIHCSRLSNVDPMPSGASGRDHWGRMATCRELFASLSWADFLQSAIEVRLELAERTCRAELDAELHQVIAQADADARAAGLADEHGHVDIDREQPIRELAEAASQRDLTWVPEGEGRDAIRRQDIANHAASLAQQGN